MHDKHIPNNIHFAMSSKEAQDIEMRNWLWYGPHYNVLVTPAAPLPELTNFAVKSTVNISDPVTTASDLPPPNMNYIDGVLITVSQ
jgi:hypothetical protein